MVTDQEKQKAYRLKYRDKILVYNKKYYAEHSTKIKAQMQEAYWRRHRPYDYIFMDDAVNAAYDTRAKNSAILKVGDHVHSFAETPTLDQSGYEKVCSCGQLAPTELAEGSKLAGCLSLEDWNKNTCFGPGTPVALQGFLLPTFRRVKCRYRFVNIKVTNKLKTYTFLQGVCARHGIPQSFADKRLQCPGII